MLGFGAASVDEKKHPVDALSAREFQSQGVIYWVSSMESNKAYDFFNQRPTTRDSATCSTYSEQRLLFPRIQKFKSRINRFIS